MGIAANRFTCFSRTSHAKRRVEVRLFAQNAAKLIADIISDMPQGVFYSENGQVMTSCNLGGICAGNVEVTNVINTDAHATYSIRSSRKDKENELIQTMQEVVDAFNKEYEGIATATITFT